MAGLTSEQTEELEYCIRKLQRILEEAETNPSSVEFGAVPFIAGGLCTNKVNITTKIEDVNALIQQLEDVKTGKLAAAPEYVAELGRLQTVAKVCNP